MNPALSARPTLCRALFAVALAGFAPAVVAGMSLGEALNRAFDQDPAYAAAQARRLADRESGEQQRSELRPRIELGAAAYYSRTDSTFAYGSAMDTYPSWQGYLRARQALLRLDWAVRNDRADTTDALAEESLADATTQFVIRVCQRYLQTLINEDVYAQALTEARAVEESLSDTIKRYDVELVPGVDVKEAQARHDLAQARLVSAKAALEDSRDSLAEVTGYDRSPLPRLKEALDIPPLGPQSVEDWVALATESSASIRRAALELELAISDLEMRRAERLPSADLVIEGTYFDALQYEAQGVSLGARQEEAKVGIEFMLPIYAGGQRASRIREARARRDEAEANYARIVQETSREVRTLFRAVETARAETRAYSQALVSATAALRATQAGYDAGTRTITDVLNARNGLVAATQQRNEARYMVLAQMLNLHATAGQLSLDHVQELDALFDLEPNIDVIAKAQQTR